MKYSGALFLVLTMLFVIIFGAPTAFATAKTPPAKHAQPQIYDTMTMKDVGETLDLLGLKHRSQDIKGANIVANTRLVVADGIVWFIYGYNCSGPAPTCSELQFRALILSQEHTPDLHKWNQQNRFVRAYTSPTGKAEVLEMDIYLAGGIALANLTDQILLWRQSLRKFGLYLEAK